MFQNSVILFGHAISAALAPLEVVEDFHLLRAQSPLDANGVKVTASPQNYVEPDEQ